MIVIKKQFFFHRGQLQQHPWEKNKKASTVSLSSRYVFKEKEISGAEQGYFRRLIKITFNDHWPVKAAPLNLRT